MSRESPSPSSSSPTTSATGFSFGSGTGAFSPVSTSTASSSVSSPSSRRSSAVTPLGDKFGRLGAGLPTVDEHENHHLVVERHPIHNFPSTSIASTATRPLGQTAAHDLTSTPSSSSSQSNGPPQVTAAKRGHVRSKSMKEQLAQFGQESSKDGAPKTLQSLQEMISSLKNLPAANHGSSNTTSSSVNTAHTEYQQHPSGGHGQGFSRHEKRLSMSSLPSRSSMGLQGPSALHSHAPKESPFPNTSTTTTLHISQPPKGTTIENALQSTVATLRRLSISDSKRPSIPTTKKDEDHQPNRRSVIIRPEEVAALQEGRPYVPSSAANAARVNYSSDEDTDAIADTLSALEGKGNVGQRMGSAAKAAHRRSVSSVDPNSLADFASKLPSHMQPGAGSAAFQNFGQSLVNNDDSQDRRRYTTAFNSFSLNRSSVIAPGTSDVTSRRLSTLAPTKEFDRKDWRMSTPVASIGGHSNRDSVNLKENASGRRPLFMAHLTYSDFHSLLTKQKHKYVQGVLRINKRNRSDAYVTVDSLPEGDVYICGSKDRNRALEGDVVGIELIDFEDMPQQKLEGGKEKKKNKRVEDVEEAGEADVEDIKPKYCGRVVSIVERSLVQMFSGTLTLQRPSGSTKKNERRRQDDDDSKGQPRIVWFKPTDKRVPLIAIPIDQAPADFVDNHTAYAHKLFLATIKRWPLSSLHPFGHLERELGDIGNIDIETEALLADNNVITGAFGEKVEKCLPELPWTIPEKDLQNRRDLRQSCTFTIDPATAKDLDDAVSCIQLEDGTYEIGVHIADVSHFIKVGSALDREAKSRATTVYLVQKAIPMLPNILCEDLCSLTANVDRLTFSVFWRMSEDGQILDTSFAKSVVRSCAQLSYDDAQRVITTGALDASVQVFGHPRSVIEDNIKTFFKLSLILRQKRFDSGALSINAIKLAFETDDLLNPVDVSVYELKESNRLIEEFMLLANMSVAKQIFDFFPEQALLRRQEEPLERRMADFIQHMNKIGIELDASSAGALQASMDAIQDPDVRKVVRLLAIKPMHRAKYFCSGVLPAAKYHHYALNAPLYTHFTSPIRRYADIIVHRLLEASLTGGELQVSVLASRISFVGS
ncbi:hypothetical protein BG011_002086 [Mortierella polycephala]|uniref:RNB domain-containing protein n=1 Tax=Mortierella polycephala TaxID=41804 RepID=A0A9P6U5J3_9FUNG|nr:hypothetical protein BG011_002086 [Mortierella polycephala]